MTRLAEVPISEAKTNAVPCPLCFGPDQKLLFTYEGKSLRKCLQCGGSFLFPQPSSPDLAAYFQGDHVPVADPKFGSKSGRVRVLSWVADYIQSRKPAGTILDVGCATGLFLTRFFSEGLWQRFGVELSRWSAEQAAKNGVGVFCGNIQEAQLSAGSIDVISVLDAFYYFPRPHSELAEFRRLLKDDGLLVLEMPLATSRIWRLSGIFGKHLSGTSHPLLVTSDHLFYYNPKSVLRLLKQCGFRVQTMVCLPGNQQEHVLRDLLYRAYGLFSRSLQLLTCSQVFLGPRFLVLAGKDLGKTPSHGAKHLRIV